MYTGALRAASNRATWLWSGELTDPSTDDAIDLTGATIALAIRDQQSKGASIEASTDSEITIATPATSGIFTVEIPRSTMETLAAGNYDVGLVVTLSDGTAHQMIVGVLPVIDGVVA